MKISQEHLKEIQAALFLLEHPNRRHPVDSKELIPKLKKLVDSFEAMVTEFESRRSRVLDRVILSLKVLLRFLDSSQVAVVHMSAEEKEVYEFAKDEVRWFLKHREEV